MYSYKRTFHRYIFLSVLALVVFPRAKASQVDHFFNAGLTAENKAVVDCFGNFRYGFSKNLELGTNAFLFSFINFLGSQMHNLNLKLKHKMFEFGRNKTSFSSYSNVLWSGKSENDFFSFSSLYGIVNTFSFSNFDLNYGCYDVFSSSTSQTHRPLGGESSSSSIKYKQSFTSHRVLPFIGVDIPIFSESVIMASFFTTAYSSFDLDSDEMAVRQADSTDLARVLEKSAWTSILTAAHRFGSFDFEYGSILSSASSLPFMKISYYL